MCALVTGVHTCALPIYCIALGAIRHGAVAAYFDANPEAEAKGVRRYPMGRLGDPTDPVALALVLCSDAGSWITGQVMPVNGGYSHALQSCIRRRWSEAKLRRDPSPPAGGGLGPFRGQGLRRPTHPPP